MAHDNQYKDQESGVTVKRFDYPKKGEWYWDRHTHKITEATEDMDEKFCIVERGN